MPSLQCVCGSMLYSRGSSVYQNLFQDGRYELILFKFVLFPVGYLRGQKSTMEGQHLLCNGLLYCQYMSKLRVTVNIKI